MPTENRKSENREMIIQMQAFPNTLTHAHIYAHSSSKYVWVCKSASGKSPFRPSVKKKGFQLHRQYTAASYSMRGSSERRRGNWNRQYFSTGTQASPSARMCKGEDVWISGNTDDTILQKVQVQSYHENLLPIFNPEKEESLHTTM